MIRIATIAAVAALFALPASAESIHISVAGKSTEQLRAEVQRAAVTLCRHETKNATFPVEEMSACMSGTINTAMAQLANPAMTVASR